jgi:hypothetical protein
MPINPNNKQHWRPTRDLNRQFDITFEQTAIELPLSIEDACDYIAKLALPEIVCFDGYPILQQEMIEDAAQKQWPELFGLVQTQIGTAGQKSEVDTYFDQHRREDGQIDWDSVSKNTVYVVGSNPLPEQEPSCVHKFPEQLGRLVLVDAKTKIG